MAIELSTIAAGLPMAASFAMAGGFVALREGRRRSALNAAVHELRRPLQAISLSLPASLADGDPVESSLELAVAAVDRLDGEINGRLAPSKRVEVSITAVARAAVDRWRPVGAAAGRSLQLSCSGVDSVVEGDPISLAQAVDNLISNALEHGGGRIRVIAKIDRSLACLAVVDEGRRSTEPGMSSGSGEWIRVAGRARHGHGLRLVRRAVAQHGGSFDLRRSRSRTEARIVLPVGGEAR